jgi:hypothetical protein
MDKEHQKIGNKTYTRNPMLIYTTSSIKIKENKPLKKEIRCVKIGGHHEVREILFKEGGPIE